jgi:hypothetical protein
MYAYDDDDVRGLGVSEGTKARLAAVSLGSWARSSTMPNLPVGAAYQCGANRAEVSIDSSGIGWMRVTVDGGDAIATSYYRWSGNAGSDPKALPIPTNICGPQVQTVYVVNPAIPYYPGGFRNGGGFGPQYRSTLGPRGFGPGGGGGRGGHGMHGLGDPVTVNTTTAATPGWELALIGLAGVSIGIFASTMYRRRHGAL